MAVSVDQKPAHHLPAQALSTTGNSPPQQESSLFRDRLALALWLVGAATLASMLLWDLLVAVFALLW